MTATDVVCLGESMVTFLPSRPGPLADVPSFSRAIGGAESNVACALAAAGHRAKWVSRVGADGFGDHLVRAVAAYGVDTSAVRRDPHRPTGVYFRTATDRADDGHEVVYYRAGSAASAMGPDTVPSEDLTAARVLHLTGITAALSADCLALLRALTARRPGRPLLSFDVNHRPGLWRGADPAVLLDLARGADLVLVGDDEARAAWGLRDAAAIRAALPEPAVLVVKHGARGATAYARGPAPLPGAPGHRADPAGHRADTAGDRADIPGHRADTAGDRADIPGHRADIPGDRPGAPGAGGDRYRPGDRVAHVAAPRVEVVAHVGAGDAFAAGFLSATLRGLTLEHRLRHGHLMAAAALTVPGDLAVPPARAHADRLAALDDDAWGRLHLGPGWTRTGEDQEARTP
ncbi:sugar kinase [Streptomyces lavendofoliae]|uniref:sugar kinase n=1 Tax=Streptomyces lavendofoliae TaxID=67314 RepID=UPI003D8DE7D0